MNIQFGCCSDSVAVVYSLLLLPFCVGFCVGSLFHKVVQCVLSCFPIILRRKKEMVVLL